MRWLNPNIPMREFFFFLIGRIERLGWDVWGGRGMSVTGEP